jgi:hypothetical protein
MQLPSGWDTKKSEWQARQRDAEGRGGDACQPTRGAVPSSLCGHGRVRVVVPATSADVEEDHARLLALRLVLEEHGTGVVPSGVKYSKKEKNTHS